MIYIHIYIYMYIYTLCMYIHIYIYHTWSARPYHSWRKISTASSTFQLNISGGLQAGLVFGKFGHMDTVAVRTRTVPGWPDGGTKGPKLGLGQKGRCWDARNIKHQQTTHEKRCCLWDYDTIFFMFIGITIFQCLFSCSWNYTSNWG